MIQFWTAEDWSQSIQNARLKPAELNMGYSIIALGVLGAVNYGAEQRRWHFIGWRGSHRVQCNQATVVVSSDLDYTWE
jgi:hypothetical protein